MKRNQFITSLFACLLTALLTFGGAAAQAQSTSFVYQGKLTGGGANASGQYDLQFKLYDAATEGRQLGATVTRAAVTVNGGVFDTTLDFGAAAFAGAARWLEIGLRPSASTDAYTTLAPRQPLAPRVSAGLVIADAPVKPGAGGIVASPYIENGTAPQPMSDFNISGNGTAAGTLSANVVNAEVQYNLGNARLLAGQRPRFNLAFGWTTGDPNAGVNNSYLGVGAGQQMTTGVNNSFFGSFTGRRTTEGRENAFFGAFAGLNNTTGSGNAFFGSAAGLNNGTGYDNSLFGNQAGNNVQGGIRNAFFGARAGFATTSGIVNSFFGTDAGAGNTTGRANAFFGDFAGNGNVSGHENTFVGTATAYQHKAGDANTFVGRLSGTAQVNGNSNTLLGAYANLSNGLSFATAIGAGATVNQNNTIVLGRAVDEVRLPNTLYIANTPDGGPGDIHLCISPVTAKVVKCALNSQGDKTEVEPLRDGLSLVNRLRPVRFAWQEGGVRDLGFIAEEVAELEPLLTFRNKQGAIEGVKYNQVSAVLISAVKEQQAQIKQQQAELAQLKQLLCATQPQAAACQPKP